MNHEITLPAVCSSCLGFYQDCRHVHHQPRSRVATKCTLLVVVIIPVGTATGPGGSGVWLVVDPEMITLSAACNSCLVFHQDHNQPRSRVATNAGSSGVWLVGSKQITPAASVCPQSCV